MSTKCEIYSAKQLAERAYSEDYYPDGFFDDAGDVLREYTDCTFVLAWETLTTQHLSDATIHFTSSNRDAVEQAELLSR